MVGSVTGAVDDGGNAAAGQESSAPASRFEVAVAFAASPDGLLAVPADSAEEAPAGGIPGVDDAAWSWRREPGQAGPRPTLVRMGEAVVRDATDALAEQIGATARRIADAIGRQEQEQEPAEPGTFDLDSVEVAFGVTLTGGVQTLFTLQAESSVQVTITLSRKH
jgi:hypothetical protein